VGDDGAEQDERREREPDRVPRPERVHRTVLFLYEQLHAVFVWKFEF